MAINLTTSPYFDDFNENKNFHKILFNPGTVVQSRELTQLQTNLQNQISKLGKFILSEGSRVSGAKVFFDNSTIAVKINYDDDILEELENYINLYVVSSVSKIVGKLVRINTSNGTLFIKPVNPSLYQVFEDGEELYVFESKELAEQSLFVEVFIPSYTSTVANGAVVTSTSVTANIFSQTLYTSTPINVQVGDIISGNTLNDFYSVTKITPGEIKVNKPIDTKITLGTEIVINRYASKKVLEVGITDGVFFSHGHFVTVQQQSFIPDENSANPTCSVGLRYNETIKDYVDDTSLLDPAINSTNYSAPGADRYVVELEMVSKQISDSEEITDLIASEKYIELVRLKNGKPILTSTRSTLGELRHTLARQLFDHAGHFIIEPFRLQFNNLEFRNANTSNLTIQISPGRAYFYGYEFETYSPVYLQTSKPTKTVNTSNSILSVSYGTSLKVANVAGILDYANTTIINLYNSVVANSKNLIGTAEARMLQYSGNSHYDLYLTNIKLTKANTTSANIISVANSSQSTQFKANSVLVQGKSWIQDKDQGAFIFSYPGQIKEERVASYTTKSFSANAYIANNKIIADAPTSMSYLHTGNIAPLNVRATYTVTAKDTYGSYNKNQFIEYNDLNVFSNSKTSQLNLINGKTYSGNVSVYVTYKVSSPTKKTKNELYGSCVVTINSCNCACLWYSDINQIEGVWDITNKNFKGEWNSANSYIKNDLVTKKDYFNRNVYICSANNTNRTPIDSSNRSFWKKIDSTKGFKISNGQTKTLYDHGRLYINTPGNTYYVGFTYFQHSNTGNYLSKQSYSTANTLYSTTFADSKSGITYDLLNSLDFRPRRYDKIGCQCCLCPSLNVAPEIIQTNAKDIIVPNVLSPIANNELTTNNIIKQQLTEIGKIVYDGEFYLPKIDVVVLGPDRKFKIFQGVPSLQPTKPLIPDGLVSIATIFYKGGATSINDIKIVYDDHKRYTMDQIGVLDKRISRIEYYNTLNLAEQSILNKTKSDPLLAQRLNSGFLADSFENFSIIDDKNPEFSCLIDIKDECARPKKITKFVDFSYDSDDYIISMSQNILHLPYIINDNDAIVTENLQATGTLIVNPFNTINLNGKLDIFPPAISQVDTTSQPDINVTDLILTDVPKLEPETVADIIVENEKNKKDEPKEENKENKKSCKSDEKVKILKENITPKAKKCQLELKARNLSPNKKSYVYINDVMVNSYCKSSSNPFGELTKIDIISGGTGYSTSNTEIVFNGANTKPAKATVDIKKGKIIGVDIIDRGLGYSSNTTIDVIGIGSGAKIKPYFTKTLGSDLVTDKKGELSVTLDYPNDEYLKFNAGESTITICDSPISPKHSKYKSTTTFSSGKVKKQDTKGKISLEAINPPKIEETQITVPVVTEETLPLKTDLNITPYIVGNTAYTLQPIEDATIANINVEVTNSDIKVVRKDVKTLKGKTKIETSITVSDVVNKINNVNIDSSGYLTFSSNSVIGISKDMSNTATYTISEKTNISLPDTVIIPDGAKISVIESNLGSVSPTLIQNIDANNKQLSLQTILDKSINFNTIDQISKNLAVDILYGVQLELDTKNISSFYNGLETNLETGNTSVISNMTDNVNLSIVANNAVSQIESVKSTNALVNQMNIGQLIINTTPIVKNTFNPKYIEKFNNYYQSSYKTIRDKQYLEEEESFSTLQLLENFFNRTDANQNTFDNIIQRIKNLPKNDSKYQGVNTVGKRNDNQELQKITTKLKTLGDQVLLSYNINN